MLVKRDLYQELGGFDENCFMYSDDVDLSYRMPRKIELLLPETTVIHYKGESTVKDGIYMKRFQESMQFFYKSTSRFQYSFRFYENRDLFFLLKCFRVAKEKKDT
jgi:GT2 family glycosyltransferase